MNSHDFLRGTNHFSFLKKKLSGLDANFLSNTNHFAILIKKKKRKKHHQTSRRRKQCRKKKQQQECQNWANKELPKEEPSNLRTESLRSCWGSLRYEKPWDDKSLSKCNVGKDGLKPRRLSINNLWHWSSSSSCPIFGIINYSKPPNSSSVSINGSFGLTIRVRV